jgi:CheY-like chemotaxis protein
VLTTEAAGDEQRLVTERPLTGLHVLLVEDDETVREMMTLALEYGGARVSECADGAQALEALRSAVPDVIVMDLTLPGANGLSIIRTIRQLEDPDAPAVPAVAVSGNIDHFGVEEIIAAGFTEYLRKPVGIDRLVQVVARLAGGVA